MAWENSSRRSRLPSDWARIRKRILRRDAYSCQCVNDAGEKCGFFATEVDHIKAGDDHSDSNLRAICEWHHKHKSSSEGGSASANARRRNKNRFVRTETHPGVVGA